MRHKRLLLQLVVVSTLLCVVGVTFIFRQPQQTGDVQIVTIGNRWFDPLGRRFRVFGLDGFRGDYFFEEKEIGRIDLTYSPDGKWVWIRDIAQPPRERDWLMSLYHANNLSTPVYSLTGVSAISWSRSGSSIAISQFDDEDDRSAVWTMNVRCLLDGLVCDPQRELLVAGAWGADWSSDDRQVVYTGGFGAVTIIDVATKQIVRTLGDDYRSCGEIEWSPTGQYLAFYCPDKLQVYNLANDTLVRPVPDWVEDYGWLPDADTLIYIRCYRDQGLCKRPFLWTEAFPSTNALYAYDVSKGQTQRITLGDGDAFENFAVWPARR